MEVMTRYKALDEAVDGKLVKGKWKTPPIKRTVLEGCWSSREKAIYAAFGANNFMGYDHVTEITVSSYSSYAPSYIETTYKKALDVEVGHVH